MPGLTKLYTDVKQRNLSYLIFYVVKAINGSLNKLRFLVNKRVIYTIGHSNHPIEIFIALLKKHGITAVADVRSVPYSRRHPQFNKDAIATSLKNEGIAYVFLGKELGARQPVADSLRSASTDEVLASFEEITQKNTFKEGIERVFKGSEEYRVALMCAEKEPLNCHRTLLVCRNLKRPGVSIMHILYDGTLEDNSDTEKRLVKLTGVGADLFDPAMSEDEILEAAYTKREEKIVKSDKKEVRHE